MLPAEDEVQPLKRQLGWEIRSIVDVSRITEFYHGHSRSRCCCSEHSVTLTIEGMSWSMVAQVPLCALADALKAPCTSANSVRSRGSSAGGEGRESVELVDDVRNEVLCVGDQLSWDACLGGHVQCMGVA
jgi:hypothetical protein